jgi:LL-diaminopimelate aminotransferase
MAEEGYIQQLFAERIGGNRFGKDQAVYKFEKIKRAKAAATAAHPDVELLDFGVGEPDAHAPAEIVERMQALVADPTCRGYADNGIDAFREAAARYMAEFFGVRDIDPATDILHAVGSKSALSLLPSTLINPGDLVLMTVPGYPVFGTHAQWYGGEVMNLPLTKDNGFLPDLDAIDAEVLDRAKAMVINYPNNPTGAQAPREFYEKLVALAKQHRFVVVQDAAYTALQYGPDPLSFLAVPGAKDVGVELHSMSKAFNMTGWRLGFVVGNPLLVAAFANVKDNSDSGQFKAIQLASAFALDHPELTDPIRAKYARRLAGMIDALGAAGFDAEMPGGGFFLYVGIPKAAGSREFATAEDFSQFLITDHLVSTVPWDDAGAFVRFSATFDAPTQADEQRVLAELKTRLAKADLRF